MQNYKLRNDSYQELKRIGEKYYSDTNFCTVIATAKACRCSFGKAYSALKRGGRKTRKGTYTHQYHKAIVEISGKTIEKLEGFEGKTVGYVEHSLPKKGTFLIKVSRHVACMVDGKIYDWTERSENNGKASRRRVVHIHEVK